MAEVKRTTEVSSNISRGCEHCGHSIGGEDNVADSINHYIEAHGYRLLHVGPQTHVGHDGKPYHTTVAVLGHDDPPEVMPPPQVIIHHMEG
jgi:hypothetical protein